MCYLICISWTIKYLKYSILTPWSRVLLQKLTGLQLVKNFPAFYGTRRFITAFTSAATCPYPEPHQSSPCFLIPLPADPFLIFYSHLRLGLPSGLFPPGLPTKTQRAPPVPHTFHTTCHPPPFCLLNPYPANVENMVSS